MKVLIGLRVILTLFVAVLLPVEQARCALRSLPLVSVAVETTHHEADDHHHGHESPSAPTPGDQADPCCCAGLQLPAATAPATISLASPMSTSTSTSTPAATHASAPALSDCAGSAAIASRSRAAPPPDPASSPKSPRGPPYSA